jgi:hypothetical protein
MRLFSKPFLAAEVLSRSVGLEVRRVKHGTFTRKRFSEVRLVGGVFRDR